MKSMRFGSWIMGLCIAMVSAVSFAAAPFSTVPQNGIFRTHIGSFEVTALSDGTIDLPMSKLLVGITPADYKKDLDKAGMTDPFETSVNTFLINTGTKLVLVDAGAGTLFGPTLGKMINNLKAAGYQPDQVDAILITHMHPDHVGGLVADGKRLFANATVYAGQADADFWLSDANASKAPEANKPFFQGAMASINPYKAADKFKPITGDGEIVPGIKSQASHGHTAGHTTYIVEDKGAKLVLIGDLVHVGAVQFGKPSVTIQFDTDQKAAEAMRKAAFTQAAKEGYTIGAAHLPFPGLGHVKADGKGFAFLPVNYIR